MALQICIAHTGERLQCADASSLPPTSLDALKAWLEEVTQIPAQDQILLTSKGKALKSQALLAENELFLYDRVLFSPSTSKDDIALLPLPEPHTPEDFPSDLTDQNSLRAWQTLFKKRREWVQNIAERCQDASVEAEDCLRQRSAVDWAARVATLNLESRVRSLEKKLADASEGFEELSKDVQCGPLDVEGDLSRLEMVPANREFARFFNAELGAGAATRRSSQGGSFTLASFVNRKTVQMAVNLCHGTLNTISAQLADTKTALEDIQNRFDNLTKATNLTQSRSVNEDPDEPAKLMQEIDVTGNKVNSDCDRVLALQSSDTKAPAAASKIALLHTRNFLPAIKEYAVEMSDLLRHATGQKNEATLRLLDNLQAIAALEAVVAATNKTINSLQVLPEDGQVAIDQVAMVAQMPFTYGSLLVEAVRRNEWIAKMRKDSATLAEEMAGYQEEEQKRRKKWIKAMNYLAQDAVQGTTIGVEINLQGEDQSWPLVSRENLDSYIGALAQLDGMSEVIGSLQALVREIDKPTRQQVKRAKTFKMGSVHEAGFGRGSLLLRGEDEMGVLQEANFKLEDELKGHKSRIRKLEDLLHRQSHVGRLSMGPGASPSIQSNDGLGLTADKSDRPPSALRPGETSSRKSSVSSRRFSANMTNAEDKTMARRIVQLEAELSAEKDARAALAKEVMAKHDAEQEVQRQIQESNSTKQDLMENMEAQQREFADERRALEEEINKYKFKIEEVEDELDRLLGSRDHERTGTAEKMQALVADYDQIKKDAAADLRKAEEDIRRRDEVERDRQSALRSIFVTLASEEAAPEDFTQLFGGLEELAQRTVEHVRGLTQAVAFAKSENESIQAMLEKQKVDNARIENRLEERDAQAVATSAELESEKGRTTSLRQQLDEATASLKDLRDRFAEGETGSETLQRQLEDEEHKVTKLTAQLTTAKSLNNSLDVELMSLQSRFRILQESAEESAKRLQQRSQRAKELSQKLYAQVDRLSRLLDALGFVVTHDQGGSMVIQRASKVGSSTMINTLDGTTSSTVQRTSSPTLASRLLDDLSDLSCILWMEKDSASDEATKYGELKEKLNRFNLDTFCDTVAKRMRDIEHTARKWQKEARNYRDKAHKYQHEAQGKIAFRSFKEGDLALFLPTRNQATRPWAAFNVGAPHYFLREQDMHRLSTKEWLVARITKLQERTVDMSKAVASARAIAGSDGRSIGENGSEAAASFEDDNPFDLSDGLRWYLLDAQEEKPGAPSTPGLGKAVVGGSNVDAKGSIRMLKKRPGDAVDEVNRQLSKSLDSRRSSNTSKKSAPGTVGLGIGKPGSTEALRPSSKASSQAVQSPQPQDEAQITSLNARRLSPSNQFLDPSSAASPAKSLSSSIRVQASSSRERDVSTSPVKDGSRTARGVWDLLGQFDISLERGQNKP